MLNIVIPMAGAGSRFKDAGYTSPKPFISIHGRPMIQIVIENLKPTIPHQFIFICQKSHVHDFKLKEQLNQWAPQCHIIELEGLTEGAACSVLAAKSLINNYDELMIANSDQYCDIDIHNYLREMHNRPLDGLIMTMKASDPKWSFVALSPAQEVTEVVEKKPISDEATVGIYNFKHGHDFVEAAETMIGLNLRTNGEFYVAPVYNQLIKKNRRIGIYNIGTESSGMYGLGTPKDLNHFLSLDLTQNTLNTLST